MMRKKNQNKKTKKKVRLKSMENLTIIPLRTRRKKQSSSKSNNRSSSDSFKGHILSESFKKNILDSAFQSV